MPRAKVDQKQRQRRKKVMKAAKDTGAANTGFVQECTEA